MPILSIIALIIQFLPAILQAAGVITPALEALIQQLGAALPGLITSLASGGGVTDDIVAVLTAFQSELSALQANTTLDADALAMAKTLDGGITDALTAYQAAGTVCDPSTLSPLPTTL